MQMSRKTVAIVVLALVVIMLIPAVAFGKPVWFTKSAFTVSAISETNFTDTVSAKIFGNGETGKILNKEHALTGISTDYRELCVCFDGHKILPFDVSVSDVMLSSAPEGFEDRFVAKLNSPMSGSSITEDQAQMSFILYTAGMSDAEINEMISEIELCVKWSFIPGITGADYIELGQ